MTMPQIQTSRLRLVALTACQLQLYLEDTPILEEELGIPLSQAIIAPPVPRAITMKLTAMAEALEELHPWYTYWLSIIESEPFGAGLLGYKGVPDAQGDVEIGYGIDPAFRSQGYTTESAQSLIAWAFQQPTCQAVTAQNVLRTNIASQRVLSKLGAHVYAATTTTQDWRIDRETWHKKSPAAAAGLSGSSGMSALGSMPRAARKRSR